MAGTVPGILKPGDAVMQDLLALGAFGGRPFPFPLPAFDDILRNGICEAKRDGLDQAG